MVVNYRLFISIWIFRINSLDNFMFKQDGLVTTLKREKYFRIVGSIRQKLSKTVNIKSFVFKYINAGG